MMKHLFTAIALFVVGSLFAQWNLNTIEAPQEFESIYVHKLSSDSLGSSFLIWVKEDVRSHQHKVHSESIYVLEGAGRMTVGDSIFNIQSGTFIAVPSGTYHSVTVTSDIPLKVLSNQSPQFLGKDRIFAGQIRRE
jgi:mannose-6-phosphate isomerase-like protein (cupin superfamily)